MHSIVSRINNSSAFLSSCMMALLAAVAISSFFLGGTSTGDISISSVKVYAAKGRRMGYGAQQDAAFINFDINTDLTTLFHWNTKQLFVYLEAEYTNMHGVQNTVVVWDKIVRRKKDAKIKTSTKNKYIFRELSTTFRDVTEVSYSLKYNLMPYVGVLTYGEAGRATENVTFPDSQAKVA